MRGAVLYGPRNVRVEERPDPTMIAAPASVRCFLSELIDLIWSRTINPG